MIVCECDHCGKTILAGEGVSLENRASEFRWSMSDRWGERIDNQFCNLPCLTGWAINQMKAYGFEKRIPERKK